jgi:hypothetical protein
VVSKNSKVIVIPSTMVQSYILILSLFFIAYICLIGITFVYQLHI